MRPAPSKPGWLDRSPTHLPAGALVAAGFGVLLKSQNLAAA